MSGDKYDDLDDLLDDDALQKSIISESPGKYSNSQESPRENLKKSEASAEEGSANDDLSEDASKTAVAELLKSLGLKEEDIKGLSEEFPETVKPTSAGSAKSFAETISETADRLGKPGNQSSDGPDEAKIMEQLLADLANGAGGSADGANMLESLMGMNGSDDLLVSLLSELSSKSVLYEPLKSLDNKFGPWMKENSDKLSAEDKTRFTAQQNIVREIVAEFEKPSYSESNTEVRKYINEKMLEMQETGAPPEDLVGAEEELSDAPCATQ